ncbi:hypothetical protein HQ524_04220 [Candidatus Uhrbacteria bacterium]|nr:hypothetical protein [Candidatus Uhrbacteria bacterium]
MNHNWHTKHFKGAFKTFRRAGTLFAIAPLGIVVGMGALIDATIVMLQIVFVAPPLPSISGNINLIAVLIVIAIISMIAQNTVIINVYKSASMKRMPGFKAISSSAKLIAPTIAIHLTTFVIAIGIVASLSALYAASSNSFPILSQIIISIVGGLLLVALFTIKTLTLHNVVGAGTSLAEAVKASFTMIRDSHGLIVEHNIVLFIINIFALIIIFTITSISLFVFSGIGLALSQFFGGTSSLFLTTAIVTLINLLMIGSLMLFNMAAWSELTRNLRRRTLPSTIRHLAKSYLPF